MADLEQKKSQGEKELVTTYSSYRSNLTPEQQKVIKEKEKIQTIQEFFANRIMVET